MTQHPQTTGDSTEPSEVRGWPEQDSEWTRIAETAARLLAGATLEDGTFRAVLPPGAAPPRLRTVVAQHRAWSALLTLLDLAPEWTHATDLELTLEQLVTTLCRPEPLDELLGGASDELVISSADRASTLESLPSGLEPLLPDRVLPTGVAAVAAARARARLLADAAASATDPEPTTTSEPEVPGGLGSEPQHGPVLPVADLVYQAMMLERLQVGTDGFPVHPWVIFCVAEAAALCALAATDFVPALNDAVSRLQTIARHVARELLASDVLEGPRSTNAVASAFCAATLALQPDSDSRYVDAALKSCALAQDPTGAWPDGRALVGHIDPDTGETTYLSSFDVAAAVADALLWNSSSSHGSDTGSSLAACALRQAVWHAADRVSTLAEGDAGWAAQTTYGRTVVETDATAAVLRLGVTARRAAETQEAAAALAAFDLVWDPKRDPGAPYLKWESYIAENEPDALNPLLPLIDERFVQPVRRHEQRDSRPWSRPRGRSLLLFGPPGTTKTTIVKAMAQGLGWPLVTLSPGDFIRDGLEHVEQRAIAIFALLEHLSEAVVLFDECDELFRSREHAGQDSDQVRSISAFMTASMLPKLQDLRDRERIIFVIAANYFQQIDAAVKRIGRIDHIIGVGWPDRIQRRRMIEKELTGSKAFQAVDAEVREKAIEQLVEKTRFYIRGDTVALAAKLGNRAHELTTQDEAGTVVDSLTAKQQGIEPATLEAFREDAAARSETHVRGRGELAQP